MNIRRFVSPDMREALNAIRAELGADAVMLSSRKITEGVEVIAAIDYDDSLLSAAGITQMTPDVYEASAPTAAFEAAASGAAGLAAEAAEEAAEEVAPVGDSAAEYARIAAAITQRGPEPVESRIQAVPDSSAQVADELKDLRRLLEMQLASLCWNDMNRRDPVRTRVLRQFAKLGVDTQLAEHFAGKIVGAGPSNDVWRLPMRAFAEKLPLAKKELTDIGGTFAVVGPTGVGKTTAIAKMAARFILRHGAGNIGLVSTDTYRIGAREQLLTFARILGAPMHVAENARELRQVLDGLIGKKLILIDTAGMSQRDVKLAKQFATLNVQGHRVNSILALSAAADRGSLAETVLAFRPARPKALIVTKIDEATSLGPAMSVALKARVPIAYLSDGQRVPEDLHVAGQKRVWLIQTALKLARDHALRPSEDDLAEQFTHLEMAAHA
jgi:flagellar biosynthesis protein FlhF